MMEETYVPSFDQDGWERSSVSRDSVCTLSPASLNHQTHAEPEHADENNQRPFDRFSHNLKTLECTKLSLFRSDFRCKYFGGNQVNLNVFLLLTEMEN